MHDPSLAAYQTPPRLTRTFINNEKLILNGFKKRYFSEPV